MISNSLGIMSIPRSFVAICLFLIVAPYGVIAETFSQTTILAKMADANRTLDYSGIFTYEHGGILRTIKVFHSVRDGQEFERLFLLSGPKKEVTRQSGERRCERLGDLMLKSSVAAAASVPKDHLEKLYHVQPKAKDRIAGRETLIVHVIPKDSYRYGYILGIDQETGLLLQSMLIGDNNRVLERFQFADVEIGKSIDEASLDSSEPEVHRVSSKVSTCLNNVESSAAQSNWQQSWLPPGFGLAGYLKSGDSGRETLIYTDGLAIFSVFIDSSETVDIPKMQAQRGATVAYLTKAKISQQDFLISVVGEIPVETARAVAHAVIPVQHNYQ